MESYLIPDHYDLVTPDGYIAELTSIGPRRASATVKIEKISPAFIGYQIEPELVFFNLKSTLAQLGLNGVGREYFFEKEEHFALVKVELIALNDLGASLLALLAKGAYIGKLFAADERRRVRDPDYLLRMFGRSDSKGRPLLSLGGLEGGSDLVLEKTQGRAVAFLSLRDGVISYEKTVYGFLPTLTKALCKNMPYTRQLLHLHHHWEEKASRAVRENEILLVRTAPLHIRTVYARVVESLLPQGFHHMTACVLQPDTAASGDIYELYGASDRVLESMPLEFYTLEPHREHVFFSDRDQLIASLENPKSVFEAMATAPGKSAQLASVFIVKGTQMKELSAKDWIVREMTKHECPWFTHPDCQALVVEKYIEHQPQSPFLRAIEAGLITSQGVLFSRHFPSPLLKRLLLGDKVSQCLKRLYFQYPSCRHDGFFSHEDRSMLIDLAKFGIPVFWVDEISWKILQYVLKVDTDSGMFVPLESVEVFRKATFFGVYGSNLQEGHFEKALRALLAGILAMRSEVDHPLLCKGTPLALVTGGGPGAMEVGNRVAKSLGILSCANIVDFRHKGRPVVNEQRINPHIEAKMTYRLDRFVERQAEFYLDFPVCFPGGIGSDFEYALEEVRRKTGGWPSNPVLLFGTPDYWRQKVASRFQLNRRTGTIQGSEWISNCFYCVQTAEQGLHVYRRFLQGTLPIGQGGPIFDEGFCATLPP